MKENGKIWLQTNSGLILDLQNPLEESIVVVDIAHGLSNVCRYSGQCNRFYSVLEHALNVYSLLKAWHPEDYQLQFDGLNHDDTEAFINDLVHPVKALCPEYKEIEDRLEKVIAKKFALSTPMSDLVKKADLIMLDMERKMLFDQRLDWELPYNYAEIPGTETIWIPTKKPDQRLLQLEFLAIFRTLKNKICDGMNIALP